MKSFYIGITLILIIPSLSWGQATSKDSQIGPGLPPERVSKTLFQLPEGLEITVWASTPQLFNPTNIDIDQEGRIWACEGVRYRRHRNRQPAGDRIVVMEDTNGDGKADSSHTFVQEEALIAPLGIGVFDNKIFVSQPPALLVYTDVNRNLVFDADIDTREVLFTGFNGRNHDHSLHSVTGGPDGKLYFNTGNCGAIFKDANEREFVLGGPYGSGVGGNWFVDHKGRAGEKSADGHVYIGGATFRVNEDGTDLEVIGHGYRNSYEQTVNSYGDTFQNDNDDPPACRVSYILEHGCAGYFTRDGLRKYSAEKRPGQDHGRNHWRQDDPGTMDVGDIYGGGSPTGVTFYENGAMGDDFVGTLLSCEPGKNTIFSYQPKPTKGTFTLDRNNFITTNPSGEFLGSDFVGGMRGKEKTDLEEHLLFRPSDIAIGPDGALYVADWYDARVGGHADLDESCSGTIYRIAPKGFTPEIPKIDLSTVEGALAALRSPALNVRYIGFHALKGMGDAGLDAALNLISTEQNEFVRARGIWLLPHFGERGLTACEALLESDHAQTRLSAYRSLRRAKIDILPYAEKMATDSDPGMRRDVALSLRNLSAEKTKSIFTTLAKTLDVNDKNSLEAFGLGAALKEDAIWLHLREEMGAGHPNEWDERFARITWRLWPVPAVPALSERALSDSLTPKERAFAVESLAFINDPSSVEAMLTLCDKDSPSVAAATEWLIRRSVGEWGKYDLMPQLKERGIYDPDSFTISPITVPEPAGAAKFTVEEVLALTGDAEKGKVKAMQCVMCHQINGVGADYGPTLAGWGKNQPRAVIASAIVNPSDEISHGFKGREIKTHAGEIIHGLVTNLGEPRIIISTGGVKQMIPSKLIESESKMNRSLMFSADQLGMSAQDVADIVSFLKVYE